MTKRRVWAGSALLLAIVFAAFYWIGRPPAVTSAIPLVFPRSGPLTVAVVGDTVFGRPSAASDEDAARESIVEILRGADVAIANLEMNLLADETAADARGSERARWPFGSAREAEAIKSLGFDVVSQANNHAIDYGVQGMTDTTAILTSSGLVAVGSGRDLGAARAPAFVGDGPRRIAVLAVAISASPDSMATPSRGSNAGWPGISALRYRADVTVDARTYDTLRRSATLQGGGEASGNRFTMSGITITKGNETSVTLVPDDADVQEILGEVRRARASAEAVVLSVHSHEPSNDSDEPAAFFETFARQAIDAGATLVVGHGPHRVRGVEVYKHGAILYSVGNFLYQLEGSTPADPFDAGVDMFSLAMGVPSGSADDRFGPDKAQWWESVVARATFDNGTLRSLQLHPADLGFALPADRRGIPRKPTPAQAVRILERVAQLSKRYKTAIRIENGVGVVEIRQE